jgi:H+/Cl- antiporter ClcA
VSTVGQQLEERAMPTTTPAGAQPSPAVAGPRPRPGRGYWLLTTLVLPVAGVITLTVIAALTDADLDEGFWDLGIFVVVGIVAAVTTIVVSRLPALRAMSRRRRAGYCLLSFLIQAVIGYVLVFATVVALVIIACENGHCLS